VNVPAVKFEADFDTREMLVIAEPVVSQIVEPLAVAMFVPEVPKLRA
jgi:hypothetical protein